MYISRAADLLINRLNNFCSVFCSINGFRLCISFVRSDCRKSVTSCLGSQVVLLLSKQKLIYYYPVTAQRCMKCLPGLAYGSVPTAITTPFYQSYHVILSLISSLQFSRKKILNKPFIFNLLTWCYQTKRSFL